MRLRAALRVETIVDADGNTWRVEVVHVCRGFYELRANGRFGAYLGRNLAAEGCEPGWADDQGEYFGRSVDSALAEWRASVVKRLRAGWLITVHH